MEHSAGNDHIDYEQKSPHHVPEEEFIDRAREGLERALKNIEEVEQRMARNLGQGLHPDRKTKR
jgi:hypothetical protein